MGYACSQCGDRIPLEDFQSGKAIYAEGVSYCAKCVEAVLPMLKALQAQEQPKVEHSPRIHRAPPRPAMDHFSTHQPIESKSSNTGLLVIGAGAAILLIIGLVVAISGGNGAPPRYNSNRVIQANTHAPPPIEPGRGGAQVGLDQASARPSFSMEEVESIRKDYDELVKTLDTKPENCEENIARLEEFKRSHTMPSEWESRVEGKISEMHAGLEKTALEEVEKYLARATELEKEWKLDEALKHLESFPEKFALVARVQEALETEKSRVRNLSEGLEKWRSTLAEAQKLVDAQEYDKVEPKLDGMPSLSAVPPDLKELSNKLRATVLAAIAEKKALEEQRIREEEEKKAEAGREKKRRYDETLASKPLHFGDWTEALPSLTGEAKVTVGKHRKHGKEYRLVFEKIKNGAVSLKFSLGTEPEIALLRIVHSSAQAAPNDGLAQVRVHVNGRPGKIVEIVPATEATKDIEVSRIVTKGDNEIKIEVLEVTSPYVLSKLELRVFLPEEEMKKEQARARATMRKLLAIAKKQERKRKKENGKTEQAQRWPPVIAAGKTVSIFNGRDLSGWKTVNAGSWTVKDGAIVGKTAGQRSCLMTELPGQASWANYEIEVDIVVVRGEVYIGVHGNVAQGSGLTGTEIGPSLDLNKLTNVKVAVANNVLSVSIDGRPPVPGSQQARFTVGAPYLSIEPNSEIIVKSVKFTLK